MTTRLMMLLAIMMTTAVVTGCADTTYRSATGTETPDNPPGESPPPTEPPPPTEQPPTQPPPPGTEPPETPPTEPPPVDPRDPNDLSQSRDGSLETTNSGCRDGVREVCECDDGLGVLYCEDGDFFECECVGGDELGQLAQMEFLLAGTWEGTVETPWRDPYPVRMTFDEDGGYSARCLIDDDPEGCVALYWGTDRELSEKQYELQDVRANGQGQGIIDIAFGPNNTNRGTIDRLAFEERGWIVNFEVFKGDHGPLVFQMTRVR